MYEHDVHPWHPQPLLMHVAWCAGGELQRFAIAVVAAQSADIYMIDEPSSYLDVRQRLKAAQVRPVGTPLKQPLHKLRRNVVLRMPQSIKEELHVFSFLSSCTHV